MTTKTMVLSPKDYFHARPAALTAAAARPFQSMVMVALGMEIADAKNAVSLMRLPHPEGKSFDVFADGPDEAAAVEAVARAIQRAFAVKG